jgi:hypothetical protein
MFARGNEPLAEPRPEGVRISMLGPEERAAIAQHRFQEFDTQLRLARCATEPDQENLKIIFHTGEHQFLLYVDRDDPRKISLVMAFTQSTGDFRKAERISAAITHKHFAAKVSSLPHGEGYFGGEGYFTIFRTSVYAEAAHAFGDSLKAYVDDIIQAYDEFMRLMLIDD